MFATKGSPVSSGGRSEPADCDKLDGAPKTTEVRFSRLRGYMTFPKEHRVKLHSTNPLERLNGEIKRRTEVVGIFPNEDAITRLVGAILLEQNDERAVQRSRYVSLETIAPLSDNPLVILPAVMAR